MLGTCLCLPTCLPACLCVCVRARVCGHPCFLPLYTTLLEAKNMIRAGSRKGRGTPAGKGPSTSPREELGNEVHAHACRGPAVRDPLSEALRETAGRGMGGSQ